MHTGAVQANMGNKEHWTEGEVMTTYLEYI